jgi:hypothetical protein
MDNCLAASSNRPLACRAFDSAQSRREMAASVALSLSRFVLSVLSLPLSLPDVVRLDGLPAAPPPLESMFAAQG